MLVLLLLYPSTLINNPPMPQDQSNLSQLLGNNLIFRSRLKFFLNSRSTAVPKISAAIDLKSAPVVQSSFKKPALSLPTVETVDLSNNNAPVVGIIETENKENPADEGEVFYIFYENEDEAQVTENLVQ